jgi:hypothetical protein
MIVLAKGKSAINTPQLACPIRERRDESRAKRIVFVLVVQLTCHWGRQRGHQKQ